MLSSLLYTNVIVGMPISRMVNTDEMTIMLVGMNIPKIRIHTIYVLLLSLVCQSGAQPTPESSGTYLPQPKTGGIVSANAYSQIRIMNLYIVVKDRSPPPFLGNLKMQPYPNTESRHNVSIDTNPDVVIKSPDIMQRRSPNFHPFCNKDMISDDIPEKARMSSTIDRLISIML